MYSKEAILKDSKTLGFLRSALAGIPDLTKKTSPAPKQTMAEHNMPSAEQLREAEDNVEEEEKNSIQNDGEEDEVEESDHSSAVEKKQQP